MLNHYPMNVYLMLLNIVCLLGSFTLQHANATQYCVSARKFHTYNMQMLLTIVCLLGSFTPTTCTACKALFAFDMSDPQSTSAISSKQCQKTLRRMTDV